MRRCSPSLQRQRLEKVPKTPACLCHVRMIFRASPSGSFTIRHSLSQTIVLFVSGSLGAQFNPEMLGFPVAANAAHADAILFASACASTVLPVPCSQRFVLSKQN